MYCKMPFQRGGKTKLNFRNLNLVESYDRIRIRISAHKIHLDNCQWSQHSSSVRSLGSDAVLRTPDSCACAGQRQPRCLQTSGSEMKSNTRDGAKVEPQRNQVHNGMVAPALMPVGAICDKLSFGARIRPDPRINESLKTWTSTSADPGFDGFVFYTPNVKT